MRFHKVATHLVNIFSNALARDHGCSQETHSKIQGIVKKLKLYSFSFQTVAYLDILESISPLLLVFKKNVLMAVDVKPAVEQILLKLEEMQVKIKNDTFTSFLHKFTHRDGDGLVALVSKYQRVGHKQKKVNYVYVEIDDISFTANGLQETLDLRSATIIPATKDRFSSLVENEVFQAMK